MIKKTFISFIYKLTLVFFMLQVVVIMGSWIAAAALPESNIMSLISSEGLRWFMGSFSSNLCKPLLIWMLVSCFAWGAFKKSGLLKVLSRENTLNSKIMFGLKVVAVEMLIFTLIMVFLTVTPHAILLSVTGHLFPSSFSRALFPLIAFIICICSLSYGMCVGEIGNTDEALGSMASGLADFQCLFLLYVVVVQLYESVLWAFLNTSVG